MEDSNGNVEGGIKLKCSACGAESVTRCGSCLKAAYCSKSCQSKDWKEGHKNECIALETKFLPEDKRYHVHLTKNMSAGQVIGKETPLATAPINTLNYEKHFKRNPKVLCIVCCKALSSDEIQKCVKCGVNMCGSLSCAQVRSHLSKS